MTYTPRTTSDAMIKPPVANRVTLPALPFTIPPATTDETAPRAPMIRMSEYYERRDRMGEKAMAIFQYGESQNWKCTTRQAADALGMNIGSVSSFASKHGFIHRFSGYRPSHRPYGNYRSGDHIGGEGVLTRFGHDAVDPNMLPLDKLIR